ncbi:MAG: flagellar protein G [Halobacteriota archaeon]|uniref:flagellar protein G n=1 Tax=Natronomonas sp. TaxID=2184060 RepID=UPI0039767292
MSGVSASTLVIFIASILVAAGVAGTLVTTVGDISSSAETRGDAITETIDADIELLNDGGGSNFYVEDGAGNSEITFYVRNTGSTALLQDSGEIDVLLNGGFVASADLTIASMNGDDDGVWAEGEVLEFVVSLDRELDSSGNRLTVSTSGTERSLEFNAD